MTEEEKRVHALASGLMALQTFHSLAERNVTRLIKYTMLCYNWINSGAITNSDMPPQKVESPYQPPTPQPKDPSSKTANRSGG
jgi:hypothetical protein